MPHNMNTDSCFHSKQELLHGVSDNEFETSGSNVQSETLEPKSSPESYEPHINNNVTPEKKRLENDAREIKFVPSEQENKCGWGLLTPQCLQVCNNSKGVLVFLCAASFLQGMTVNGFLNTVITTIERRFDLRSYHSGLIASSYDIAACLCLTFVSYFGGNGHKPRWLGCGVFIMGIGSFIFALPHFTTDSYKTNFSSDAEGCHSNHTQQPIESVFSLSNYRFVFMLGQFLHGIGATPLYTLGVTYLDENVKSSNSPVYIGIFYTAAIVGPAVGYLLGGFFLNIYTDISSQTDLTPGNPLWVGAWWIGFLAAGVAGFLISMPILAYPQQLPGSERYVVMRVSEAHQVKDSASIEDPEFGKTIKDLPKFCFGSVFGRIFHEGFGDSAKFQMVDSVHPYHNLPNLYKDYLFLTSKVNYSGLHLKSFLMLLKNPTFVFLCLAGATEATLITGMSTFGPKFLESQFSLSASQAATFFGYLVVPAGGGGTFLGGFIVNKLKLNCSGVIKLCLICTVIGLLSMFVFLLSCPNLHLAGVTAPYPESALLEGSQNLTSLCNADCRCLEEIYNPVCGVDNIMYYSACHAGCSGEYSDIRDGQKVYQNCSCVAWSGLSAEAKAVAGKCLSSCKKMPLLLAFLFLVILFTFLCSVPALTATLRCVSDNQRSFALGIQWILARALGAIPGPIAFGSMIDISCLRWQKQGGANGSCYFYQNSDMSNYMLMAGLVYKVLGLLFFLLALMLYKPPSLSPSGEEKGTNCIKGDAAEIPRRDMASTPS